MAAHLEECKYFDHCAPSQQFRYCFIVQPNDQGGSRSNGEDSEIGLEYAPGQSEGEPDEIVLECQMSEESVTDSETDMSASDSEVELLVEEH